MDMNQALEDMEYINIFIRSADTEILQIKEPNNFIAFLAIMGGIISFMIKGGRLISNSILFLQQKMMMINNLYFVKIK